MILTGKRVSDYDHIFDKWRDGIVVCHYGKFSETMAKIFIDTPEEMK